MRRLLHGRRGGAARWPDIYNVDETGLVYNALPAVTLSTAGDAHGGKTQKERVTLLVGANLTGYDKLKLVFVGKAKNPRCLKHVDRDSLPVWFVEARARSGAHRSSHLTDHAAGGPSLRPQVPQPGKQLDELAHLRDGDQAPEPPVRP